MHYASQQLGGDVASTEDHNARRNVELDEAAMRLLMSCFRGLPCLKTLSVGYALSSVPGPDTACLLLNGLAPLLRASFPRCRTLSCSFSPMT